MSPSLPSCHELPSFTAVLATSHVVAACCALPPHGRLLPSGHVAIGLNLPFLSCLTAAGMSVPVWLTLPLLSCPTAAGMNRS